MIRIVRAATVFLFAGLAAGVYSRELTRQTGFPDGQFSQLGVAHTHLLVLGFIVLLIALALERLFRISESPRLFSAFFWLYCAGVTLTSAMLVWHGTLTVLGRESSPMISGLAGLGHIAITAGLVCFSVALGRAVTARAAATREEALA